MQLRITLPFKRATGHPLRRISKGLCNLDDRNFFTQPTNHRNAFFVGQVHRTGRSDEIDPCGIIDLMIKGHSIFEILFPDSLLLQPATIIMPPFYPLTSRIIYYAYNMQIESGKTRQLSPTRESKNTTNLTSSDNVEMIISIYSIGYKFRPLGDLGSILAVTTDSNRGGL